MADLIARLEAAGEGSRELDKKIAWAADPSRDPLAMLGIPHYTTSLDAALTLVPGGYEWEMQWIFDSISETNMAFVQIGDPLEGIESKAATPALALCIAAIKAREHSNG